MQSRQVLLLAMTRMRSGICVAGLTPEPDPTTRLRWVRPVRDFDTVQPGDMSDADGRLYQCGDVVELCLIEPRPDVPHVEDWLTDFTRRRPRFLRHLTGAKRTRFFLRHLDRAPEDVVIHCHRSLCLVKPDDLWAGFSLDTYSGKYEARMGFHLKRVSQQVASPDVLWCTSRRGITVTDIKWRTLGRDWLGDAGGNLKVESTGLCQRLGAEALYLTIGLSRSWQGKYWPLVVGVHTDPDYETLSTPAYEL